VLVRKNIKEINRTSTGTDTALVFINPQNEVLSEKGLAWGAMGNSIKENKTIENMERNMERIFKAATA